jgi:gas vesicle protein
MGRLLKGITFGAIVGFIAGLLLAPKKEEQTRKKAHDEKAKKPHGKRAG